jgi:hypothetical protein
VRSRPGGQYRFVDNVIILLLVVGIVVAMGIAIYLERRVVDRTRSNDIE